MKKIPHLCFLLLIILGFTEAGVAQESPPNILFLFADDQAFDTVNSMGFPEVQTPNIDRLVERGTTFTHTYNMGGWHGAICVASRTMLLTGRSLWNAQREENELASFAEEGRTWPQWLGTAGYRTYFSGKWHIKLDTERVFDVVRHVRPGMPNQTDAGYNRPVEGQPDAWSPRDPQFEGFWKGGIHWSEVLANDALDYLSDAKKNYRPFFMYLAFNAPHDPRQSPKEYVDRYPLDEVAIPENYLPEYPHKEDIGSGEGLRDEKLAPFPRTEHAVKTHRQEYYAIITHMDAQIGRILDALEASGKAEETIIVFTADHGLAVGHHGFMGKQNMYDHSVRVPFVISGPGIPSGKRLSAPIYLQDIVPTTLELAGVPISDAIEFRSLVPWLKGDSTVGERESIYGAYMMLQRHITSEGYKLILYPKNQTMRLYDIKNDPHEMLDLAEDLERRPLMQRLFQKLQEHQRDLGDPLDLREAFPDWVSSSS